MPSYRIYGVLLLVTVLSVGCVTVNSTMRSWEGHHVSELLASWGAPTAVFSDDRGGQVFIYTLDRTMYVPGQATTTITTNPYGGTAYTTYTPAVVEHWPAHRTFFIDARGYVYGWAWRGL